MSVKSGQILVSAAGFVVDRVQTGGLTNLNIPVEQVKEVGNFLVAGQVYDIPDATFEIQSLDVSTDIEALVLNANPSSVTTGPGGYLLDFYSSTPINVLSPWRSANYQYNITAGVIIPFLSLEQVQYRYGLRANAMETFTMRGDAAYFVQGTVWQDVFAVNALTSWNFLHGPALPFQDFTGTNNFCVSAHWVDYTTGLYGRMFPGANYDFTDTSTGITLNAGAVNAPPATATLYLCYGSSAARTYPAGSTAAVTATKPAAIRSKDIDVFIGSNIATPVYSRLTGVQSVELTRRVTLIDDEEFGNKHYIQRDYDIAEVTGTLTLKNVNPVDVMNKIGQLAGIGAGNIVGPYNHPSLGMEIRIYQPDTHTIIKTLYIPDAQFVPPPVSPAVGQKLETKFQFRSASGLIQAFKGAR